MPLNLTFRPGTESAFEAGDAAARAAKKAAKEFEAALALLRAQLDHKTIAEAIKLASLEPITSSPAWLAFGNALEEVYRVGGPIQTAHLTGWLHGEAALGALGQDVRDVAAEIWLREHGAELVREVSESTIAGIRQILVDSLASTDRRTIRAARDIVNVRGFGLHSMDQTRLAKYARQLRARKGITGKEVSRLLGKRHDKLVRERARTIARHELRLAGEQGKRDLWRAAAFEGRLDPTVYVIEWVARVSGACPRCRSLDGAVISVFARDFFGLPVDAPGTKLHGRVERVGRPPLHVRCYCGTRLTRIDELKWELRAVARKAANDNLNEVVRIRAAWGVEHKGMIMSAAEYFRALEKERKAA